LHRVATYYDKLSFEHEFLLKLFGKAYQERSSELHRAAAQVDWNRLFAITPPDLYGYLGHKLTESGLHCRCPAFLQAKTLNARRATAAQWLRFGHELRRLAAEFARYHTDFLLLKGAVLAFLAYPDSSLRPLSDIDILVRPGNLPQALEGIEAAGFRCPERYKYAHPATLVEFSVPGEEISLPLEKAGTRALIEVHTQLESTEPWFPVSIAQVWECAEEADLDGFRTRILERHEFLFHLILHLARGHLFSVGLRPLLDVHLWMELQGRRLDWERIASECDRRGYNEWAHLTLKIVSDMFGTEVPEFFLKQVPPPPASDRLQRLAYQQIWADRRLDSLVPQRLAITFSQRTVMGAISSLFRRVRPGRLENGPTVPRLGILEDVGLAAAFERMLNEVKVKAPQYIRAWRRGNLRFSSLLKAARLARGRIEIKEILIDRREAS
jgi:hypothetical protein